MLDQKGFTSKDFAKYHPGGALGKRLYLKVGDLYPNNAAPQVNIDEDIRKVIVEISSNRLGAVAVLKGNKLVGIITDGDIRRMLLNNKDFSNMTARSIMNTSPKISSKDQMAVDALSVMKEHNISQLIVAEKGKYIGMIHLHDLIREGII